MEKSTALLRALSSALLVLAAVAGARPAPAQGVTLFRDRSLRGPSQTFYDDVPDLRYTQFGSRRASSIAVPPGCVAVLYEKPRFGGRRAEFRAPDNDLSNTAVGEDTASSLRVNCRHSGPETHYHPDWHEDRPYRPGSPGRPEYGPPPSRPEAPSSTATARRAARASSSMATSRTSIARDSAAAWRARSTSLRDAWRSSTNTPTTAAGAPNSAKGTTT